ncbi:MAG TPA: GSCFA domain-containing protein [Ferrovibrio sp.]|uniref:GSCFA domain-containing protein n=1 Tax=Ferrovibrio sp. TaxID=1917215 RepID=UPI002ED61951
MFFKELVAVDRPNKKWEALRETGKLTVKRNLLFNASHRFFTIGSCFAEEIRKALTARNVICYPEYRKIKVDHARMRVDTLPHREHMNYYNTFSIRQEVERAAGLWVQDKHDIWEVANRTLVNGTQAVGEGTLYQDPYRRLVFGKTPADLWEALEQIDAVMKEGMLNADACFITLGMTEVFKKKNNGLVCNQIPVYAGGAGLRETYYHQSTFDENYQNIKRALLLLKQMNPKIQVVLTVSPVPLERSFNEHDVFVNNMESKTTLRAVAGQICREFDWVHYFPSFEIVWGIGVPAYQEDRVHVKPEIVQGIISTFLASHFTDLGAAPASPAAAAQ